MSEADIDRSEGADASKGGSEGAVEKSPEGRYLRYRDKLGRGAFKTVYKGIDTYEMREVAWNAVSIRGIPTKEKARIVAEVQLLHTLAHTNLIQFYGSWYNKVRFQSQYTA